MNTILVLLIHSLNANKTYFFFSEFYSSDLRTPAIVVLNTSNQEYFVPPKSIESTEDMVHFIYEILEGVVEVSVSLGFKTFLNCLIINCIPYLILILLLKELHCPFCVQWAVLTCEFSICAISHKAGAELASKKLGDLKD